MSKEDDIKIENLETCMSEVKADIKVIKENHLAHIQVSLASIEKDMDWIKRFFWLLIPAIVAL
ncbi:MAG: hypothetical protein WC842_04330, partial [Candidatus Paceibacterota bacterium]